MFEYSPFYRRYHRYNYNNYNYSRNNYNNYNPAFTPMYNYFTEPINNYNNDNIEFTNDKNNISSNDENNYVTYDSYNKKGDNPNENVYRIGPIEVENNTISAFGFSIAIDDLIIIILMILLFFQSDRDYTLIIILGLMLFNITFSNFDFFRGL